MVVDDIVTTGATLAAVTTRLREANMQVTGAAVLAATRLRRATPRRFRMIVTPRYRKGGTSRISYPETRGDGRASAR